MTRILKSLLSGGGSVTATVIRAGLMVRRAGVLECVVLALAMAGCGQSLEEELDLKYTAPAIPADLERFFTPTENQRAIQLLDEGETSIDMHEYYLGHHRMGRKWAIEAESANREHYYKSLEDVRVGLDAMMIGQDAFWPGYKSAVDQISSARKNMAE